MGEKFESSGTAWMRVKRNNKPETIRIEDMTRDEFTIRFDKNSAGFLDYLAERVRWHESVLEQLGFKKEPDLRYESWKKRN